MKTILELAQERKSEILDSIKGIVDYESPSRRKELTDKLADKLVSDFVNITGGTAKTIPSAEYGNHVLAEWGSGEEQILIIGHFDTVWEEGTLARKPFKIDETGKAYGPGIFDMKTGVVQGMYALQILRDLKIPMNKKVVMLMNSDEEIGSLSSRPLIEAEAKKSTCVLILEPSFGDKVGKVKTSRKGIGIFKIETTGKAAHAGTDHANGESAIEELSRQIQHIHSLTNYETGTTFNVGKISGGTAQNVVAAHAVGDIDLRVWNNVESEKAQKILRDIKAFNPKVKVEISGVMNRPPLERNEGVVKMYTIAKEIAKKELAFDLEEGGVGGASDGNFTAPFAPTLDGLGAVGDGAHAESEFIYVEDVPVRTALLAHLIVELGK